MAGVKGKKRKRKADSDNPDQSKRFIEGAKALGLDESGKEFERVIGTLLPPKKPSAKKTGG